MGVRGIKTSQNDRFQLELALTAEKAAFENYQCMAEIVKSKEAKKRLEKLAEEEKAHFETLVTKYEQLFGKLFNLETVGRMTGPLCEALWNFLGKEDKDNPELKIIRIVELAIYEEQNAIFIYTRAANRTNLIELKEFFSNLAEIEKKHMSQLREERRKLERSCYWIKA